MKKQDFNCSISVAVPPGEALDAIMNVSAWWAKNVTGNPRVLNSIFSVHFGETYGTFKIAEMIPGRKILWEVIDCYLPKFKNVKDWMNTKISWGISTEDNITKISFRHIGLVPGKECYHDCQGGWSFFVKESVPKLITEGKGLPGVGIRFTISAGERTYNGILFLRNDPMPEFQEDHILIDVKDILGKHVLSAHSAEKLDKANFKAGEIKGGHFMLVADKPVFGNIDPLKDILETIKSQKK